MTLYLARHGRAVGSVAGGDAARWLTDRGRAEIRQLAAELARRAVPLDCIVSSPLVRAVQTAELFAAALGFAGTLTIISALQPSGEAAAAALSLAAAGAHVLAVSHEPLVSTLAGELAGVASSGFAPSELWAIGEGERLFRLLPRSLS